MFITGKLAKFDQVSSLQTQKEFLSSCTIMELDVFEKTTVTNKYNRKITGPDRLVYTERMLQINLEFKTGLFMKIEQEKDYSG
jgi:hypothetical protein